MSVLSEASFFFSKAGRVDDDESMITGCEGSMSGTGMNDWNGAIFLTRYRVCIASAPGFVSKGFWGGRGLGILDPTDFSAHEVRLQFDDVRVTFKGDGLGTFVEAVVRARANVVHPDAAELLDACTGLIDADRYDQALKVAEQIIAKDRFSAIPWGLKAEALLGLNRFDEVFQACDTAVGRGTDEIGVVRALRGMAMARLDRLPEAEQELQMSLKEGAPPLARAELVSVQLALGRKEDACRTLKDLVAGSPDDEEAHRRLLFILCDLDRNDEARMEVGRYAEKKFADASVIGLVRAHVDLAAGRLVDAQRALDGVPVGGSLQAEHQHLQMKVAEASGDHATVEKAARAVLRHGDDADVLASLLQAQLHLRRWAEVLVTAGALEALTSSAPTTDPQKTARSISHARAVALTLSGVHDEAAPAIHAARGDLVQAQQRDVFFSSRQERYMLDYLEARLAAAGGRREQALALLRHSGRLNAGSSPLTREIVADIRHLWQELLHSGQAAVRPDTPVARSRRDESRALLQTLDERALRDPRFAFVHERVRDLGPHLDRPLLVAVMGEFNAGKSTFINALLGIEVLPVDVVPTTATINVLSHGDRESARVVWRDGATEEVPLADLRRYLTEQEDAAGNAAIRNIRHVELHQPLTLLKTMNIIDTPGLNALIDEHQQVTSEYLQTVDAILWLFRADQAGKSSEKAFLDVARRHSAKTIAVINRIDRVPKEEIEEVMGLIRQQFEGYFAAIAPVSARRAQDARQKKDNELFKASGFPAMFDVLKEQVLKEAQRIKIESLRHKLRSLLDEVQALATQASAARESRRADLARRRAVLAALERRGRQELHDQGRTIRADWNRAIESVGQDIAAARALGALQPADIERYGRRVEALFAEAEKLRVAVARRLFEEASSLAFSAESPAGAVTHALASADGVAFQVRLSVAQELATAESQKWAWCLRGRLLSGDLLGAASLDAGSIGSAFCSRLREFSSGLFEEIARSYDASTGQLRGLVSDWFDFVEEDLRGEELQEQLEVFGPILELRGRIEAA